MKKYFATATVRFKKSVLEPQGQAVQLTLAEKGLKEFSLVRVGKIIEVELEAESLETAKKKMEDLANSMLYNDVMETCELTVRESSP
ncbi:MAG: Phosphoribosylformylglycinamidine synthase subunit PurS [Turneriella sp.]|nr:Phosphoribosylformylglycinamidine synthase subunit PurS [Turneriella sp.]